MCGIYGFQETPGTEGLSTYEKSVLMYILADAMENRGKDSFGSITMPDGHIYKGLGRVAEAGVNLLAAAVKSSSVLAHTRTATVGEVSIPNCHPFTVGNVRGVHNGSITNYAELNGKYGRDCKVDSEHMFYHLNEHLPLHDIEGYGTFFWSLQDEQYSKIYFGRTTGGALGIAKLFKLSDKETPIAIVWASEFFAIRKAARILGLDVVEIIQKPDEIYSISDGEVRFTNRPFKISYTNYSKSVGMTCHSAGFEYFDVTADDDDKTPSWLIPQGWRGKRHVEADGNTLDEEDETTPPILTPSLDGIANSMVYLIGAKKYSKRERKNVKKRLIYYRNLNSSIVREPDPEKLHNGIGLRRHFAVDKTAGNSVGAQPILHCSTCECDVRRHLWGWCQDEHYSNCKAAVGKGCNFVGADIKICASCGHYLVAGTHTVDAKYAIVHCILCNDYCVPQSQIIGSTRVNDDTPTDDNALEAEVVGEVTEPKAVTDNVIAFLESHDLTGAAFD